LVNVEIDGKSVTDGGMILDANREFNLERAIAGDLKNGRKFKFIEKTEEISEFRGDRVDDGLIRITYQFERQFYVNPAPYVPYVPPSWPNHWTYTKTDAYGHQTGNFGVTRGSSSGGGGTMSSCCFTSNDSAPKNEFYGSASGITVEGSKSNQSFSYGSIGSLETETYSMVFQLIPGTYQPVTVDRKIQCHTCGRKWKGHFEFCGNCGTALRK
jgi:hypothetical protein